MLFEVNGKDIFISSELEHELELTEQEKDFVDALFDMLKDCIDLKELDVMKKASEYATVIIKSKKLERGYDLVRFKLTPRTMWAAVWMTPETMEKCGDDALFDAQKNKKQSHWKSKLNSPDDVLKLKPVLIAAIEDIYRVESL